MKEPRTLPLLLEVGCEEIPARFLTHAQRSLEEYLHRNLRHSLLMAGSSPPPQCFSTPRRLVAWVPQVLWKQQDKVVEIAGPPVSVGLDGAGKPTRAAESFALKHGARVEDLVPLATVQGERLAIRKPVLGRLAMDVLPELLPQVLKETALTFPKSMYWLAKSGPHFVRPVRWILAILGEEQQARTVPFEFAGVRASNVTYGHRAVSKRPIAVRSIKDYLKKLRKSYVELDPEERRTQVVKKCKALLEVSKQAVVEDPGLLEWIVNSCEWPKPLAGTFEERFLHLPREILVTVMRDHQKYFAVEDTKGNLQPRFVTVLNMEGDKKGWIREGHRRVLTARFTDAEFFWEADQRLRLEDRRARLAQVIYEAELGTYAEKVRRMRSLAHLLCEALEGCGMLSAADSAHALRAVELAKCDLTTQMVKEFPELQGIVGGLYARAQGEPQQVCDAIYDHYLPQGMDERCPRSVVGGVVSLADKIDGVGGGFAVGRGPTGSSDPFALRREASGIIKVMLELRMPIDLRRIIEHGISALNIQWRKPQLEVFNSIWDFLGDRLRYYLETVRGLRYDTVRAVLAAGWDAPLDALRRAEALEATRGSDDFLALSVAAKRIKNILAKSATASDWQPGEVDESALGEEAERELHRAYLAVAAQTGDFKRAGEYRQALEAIAGLRPMVDRFFDKVLVMAEDPVLRQNRLRLLGKLDQLFSGIAHFAEIVASAPHVDASTSPA